MKRLRQHIGKRVYMVPSTFLNLRLALSLMALMLLVGVCGFWAMDGYTLVEAFYMTIITVTTVGFAEVHPLSENGKIFISIFILVNTGVVAYLLAVFSFYVIQGEIFKKMHTSLIQKKIDKLSGHIIVCGYGKYGKEVSINLTDHQVPHVVIDNTPEAIEEIRNSEKKILYLQDDATHDEALMTAGIKRAKAVISALPDDSDNVFIVLTARELNPKIDIISRAKSPKTQKKLQMAGADHVIMPEQIGGFYMATLISKPDAVEFFSFITNESQPDVGFEEIDYEDMPKDCQNKSIEELEIRQRTGANIIAYKAPDGHFLVNPPPETILLPESSFILLGNKTQLENLRKYLIKIR